MMTNKDDYTASIEELGKFFYRLPRNWRTLLDQRLAPLGLTQTRWMTLYGLEHAGPGLMQRELAEIIGVEAPSLVRTLDQLAKQGLVERRGCKDDRRSKRIFLTPAAAPLLTKIRDIVSNVRIELMEGIDAEEISRMLGVFNKMEHNCQRLLDQS